MLSGGEHLGEDGYNNRIEKGLANEHNGIRDNLRAKFIRNNQIKQVQSKDANRQD